MIQIIGLIIAVYAGIRLIQVPIEFTRGQDGWTPMIARFIVVTALSACGLLALAILTAMLLLSGAGAGSLR